MKLEIKLYKKIKSVVPTVFFVCLVSCNRDHGPVHDSENVSVITQMDSDTLELGIPFEKERQLSADEFEWLGFRSLKADSTDEIIAKEGDHYTVSNYHHNYIHDQERQPVYQVNIGNSVVYRIAEDSILTINSDTELRYQFQYLDFFLKTNYFHGRHPYSGSIYNYQQKKLAGKNPKKIESSMGYDSQVEETDPKKWEEAEKKSKEIDAKDIKDFSEAKKGEICQEKFSLKEQSEPTVSNFAEGTFMLTNGKRIKALFKKTILSGIRVCGTYVKNPENTAWVSTNEKRVIPAKRFSLEITSNLIQNFTNFYDNNLYSAIFYTDESGKVYSGKIIKILDVPVKN
jgi:hypothetical protein